MMDVINIINTIIIRVVLLVNDRGASVPTVL